MTYEPLHHKYRPQKFADLVGQEAVAATLTSALKLQRIAPAYLFSGPRGTGKTSSARILAKSLNCLSSDVPTADPCGTCNACTSITRGIALDVIEIDAASNTGVDNIRELIERAQFAPVQCRHKIYCLDEVHMLSTAAFNALLKTLEEPPDHVVFVLATTDPQRVLPTIISRCQRFDFRRIPLQAMVDHLIYIAQQEKIDITPSAIELIAQLSQGGLRDAESLLDQLSLLAAPITSEHVWDLAGTVPEQDLLELVQAIAAQNAEVLVSATRQLLDRGREPLIVLQNLTGFYRDLLIAKTAPDRRDLVAITAQTWTELCHFSQHLTIDQLLQGQQHLRTCEIQVKNTTQPRLWLEITLLGLMTPSATVPLAMPTPANLASPSPPQELPATTAPTSQSPKPYPPQTAVTQTQVAQNNAPQNNAPQNNAPQNNAPQNNAPQNNVLQSELSEPPPVPPVVQEISAPSLDALTESTPTTTDLNQVWSNLQPRLTSLTSALLVEHGKLLSLRTSTATIGMKNKALAKIAQSKQADIETGFEQILHRKIKVNIEILSSTDTIDPNTRPAVNFNQILHQNPVQSSSQVNPKPTAQTVSPSPSPSPSPPPLPPPSAPPSSPSLQSAPPMAVSASVTPVPNPEVAPLAAPSQSSVSVVIASQPTDDDLTIAAKSFASFFNGNLVTLTEDIPEETEPQKQ